MAALDKLMDLLQKNNVAKGMSGDKLQKIAEKVIRGYKLDRESRSEWEERCEDALKFAKQITEKKNFPWEGSSNVIFPLLSLAAVSFASKTYPEIVKEGRIVKCAKFGNDPQDQKEDRAFRVSSHMSWQRLIQSNTWEPDTDKLLHMLPVIGTCFRKVYYDVIDDLPQSDLCSPEDVVVNYNVPSFEKAHRVTHRYVLNHNDMIEQMRNGYFLNIDLDKLPNEDVDEYQWDTSLDTEEASVYEVDENKPHEFLEQHTFADLDGDGYAEPWIIVVHKASEQVVGIYPRFDETKVSHTQEGEILRIKPINYFVDYHFLRSPDGGFYSLGYGHLLYPLNEAINSLMNQLIDSGTLSNTNSGLISRDLKLKGGKIEFKMGEFVPVDPGTTGRISDSVYKFEFNPPSPVLMQLLSLVIASAKEIASINEILTGDAKPQNSPAHSVMELANQGMKTFNAIAKRLHRSLKKEFELLYNLNYKYLDEVQYFNYQDRQMAVVKEDYNPDDMDIAPVADPSLSSDVQKMTQANAMNQLLQNQAILPELKVNNIVREFFEALKIPKEKIDQFIFTPQEKMQMQQNQPPNADMMKIQLDMQKMQKDYEIKMAQVEKSNRELELKYLELVKRYAIKDEETAEKQARMMADARYKDAQAKFAGDKVEIEKEKVEVMKDKAENERRQIKKQKDD